MRRPFFGALSAAGGMCAVLIGLAAIDGRVRGQVAQVLSGRGPSGEILEAGGRMQDLAAIMLQAAQDQSIEHAPLVIFAVAAMILVMFMLRT
jgi:hypothetical protein